MNTFLSVSDLIEIQTINLSLGIQIHLNTKSSFGASLSYEYLMDDTRSRQTGGTSMNQMTINFINTIGEQVGPTYISINMNYRYMITQNFGLQPQVNISGYKIDSILKANNFPMQFNPGMALILRL